MTVQTSQNKTIALGNGSQTQFDFSFVGVAAAYIGVIYTDASGNETVLSQGSGATQYQIALNAPVAGALWGVGGTVTYDPSGTPIAAGTSLTIFRTLPLTQAISLQNLVSLSTMGNGAETGLDTLEMQIQQVSELFGRSLVAPIVDPDTINLTLPAAAQRANTGLAFDSQGNVIAGTTPATGLISSAMQPVVDAASLAAGRTALGLGAMAVEGIGAGLQDDGSGNARVNSPIQEVAVNQAIHAANHLNIFAASGALTFTLDRANTLFDGFSFTVYALTAAITFAPNAADNFFGQSSGASLVIPARAVAKLTTDGASSGLWIADVSGVSPVINVQKFTANGTYTPSPGLLYAVIECLGGGGGGSGTQASPTGITGGGGGQGGVYARKSVSASLIGTSQVVTVGTAGAAGAVAGNGGNGGATSVGTLCSANGGHGGIYNSVGIGGSPGTGGTGGTGDVVIPGAPGGAGLGAQITTLSGFSGFGGGTPFGSGAPAQVQGGAGTASGAAAAANSGGGGSGAINVATGTGGSLGGAGGTGLVVITEFLAFAA
jgi:hypothetical protein